MAFMQPDVFHAKYFTVQTDHGATWYVPYQVIGRPCTNAELQDYVEGTVDEPDEDAAIAEGWLARLSAPGYLDCTDWSVHPTKKAAYEYLRDTYDLDDEDEDSADEGEA